MLRFFLAYVPDDFNTKEKLCTEFFFLIVRKFELFLINYLQNPRPPPLKKTDGKIFLAYLSDDFKTKKYVYKKKKITNYWLINCKKKVNKLSRKNVSL